MVDNKSIDFSDTGDAEFGEDSNGNAYIKHKSSGKRLYVSGDGTRTKEFSIEDPAGNAQMKIEGIGAANSLKDEDTGYRLDHGVLISQHPEDNFDGIGRVVLGRGVGIGLRKNDTLPGLDSGEGGSAEFIKNPPGLPSMIIENDIDQGQLRFESKEGGGHVFLTSRGNSTVDGAERLRITDPQDTRSWGGTAQIWMHNLDKMGIGVKDHIAFYEDGSGRPAGVDGRAGFFKPQASKDQLVLTLDSNQEFAIEPDYKEMFRATGEKVYLGSAPQTAPINLPPHDVTVEPSPEAGDVAYNDGTVGAEGLSEYRSDGKWYHIATDTVLQ